MNTFVVTSINLTCLILLSFLVGRAAEASEIPVEAFSRLPYIESPAISPDGTKIAFIQNIQDPELTLLMVADFNTGLLTRLLQTDNLVGKVRWFKWANNQTIILGANFIRHKATVKVEHSQLLAIDIDKEKVEQRRLINNTTIPNRQHFSQFEDTVIDVLDDDPEHILISLDARTANLPSVFKLNIYTSKARKVENRKLKIRHWMTDQQGHVRLGQSIDYDSGEYQIFVRQGDDSKWISLFKFNGLEDPPVTPLGFAKNPNELFYTKYKNDKKALFKVDLSTNTHQLVFADKDYDADGSLIYSKHSQEVIGLTHITGNIYWDAQRKNLQHRLDSARPEYTNRLVDFSEDEYVYIFYSENDHTPGSYYLANRRTGKVTHILSQYPELRNSNLPEHKRVEYYASDKTKIEGYLTLPINTKQPVATILFPHGGPGVRDTSGFDYWTSFFVSRGYAVFRPNFRGSKGYGYQFAQSQKRNWGLVLQDDLTDAANWLVAEKIADPERMCIVGASYGGYAAAMAAVKTPDLFKCAISFAGVSDLKSLVFKSRYYVNRKFVENQIGEDADDLIKRSPLFQAEKINIPILLIHGAKDTVVNVRQSQNLEEKLRDLGKPVQYIELENGDHYLSIQHNRHDAFKAMNNFLKQHLNSAD